MAKTVHFLGKKTQSLDVVLLSVIKDILTYRTAYVESNRAPESVQNFNTISPGGRISFYPLTRRAKPSQWRLLGSTVSLVTKTWFSKKSSYPIFNLENFYSPK